MFGLTPSGQSSSHSKYVSKWRRRIQEAYSLASKLRGSKIEQRSIMTARRMVWNYSKNVECWWKTSGTEEEPGNSGLTWRRKSTLWQRESTTTVQSTQCSQRGAQTRILHWNLLLPCDFLPADGKDLEKKKPNKRKSKFGREEDKAD